MSQKDSLPPVYQEGMPSPIDYMDPNFVEQNNIYLPEAQDPHRYSFSNNLMPRNEHN